MSVSKEEREYWRQACEANRDARGLSFFHENTGWSGQVYENPIPLLLDDLDAAEEKIAALDRENQHIAELVSEVYLEITDGEISKPDTNPTVVLDYARESNERDHAEDLRMKDEKIAELEAEVERLTLEAQDARTFPLKHRGDWTHYRMCHDLELSLNTETGETDYRKDQTYALSAEAAKPEFVLNQAKAARKHSAKVKHGGPYSKVTQFLDEWIQGRTT